MINVRVTTTGIDRLHKKITNRANFLGGVGMEVLLDNAGSDLVEAYKEKIMSFTPGGAPDLAESTKKQKMRQVGSIYPILKRFGIMMNSMYTTVTRPSGGHGWIVALGFAGSQNGVSNARIAEIHIKGEGRMPMRDFTKVPSAWSRSVFNRIRAALSKI